jgi:3-deoxy-D-manno-octulosonic-acid transferase
MLAYSALLAVGLVLSAPWWLLRMATTSRYREGLRQRLGAVPYSLEIAVRRFRMGRRVIWVHAVSVGEVLAATRLVAELEGALGDRWRVVVSTTTRTGQALARERFGAERVFYMPLDFAWVVRAYLRALRPAALILMESELWPRMLHECRRAGVSVAVVNARVSDRSFARAIRVRWVWGRVLRGVTLWLAQSDEDARRLVAMGASADRVRAIGNLKYDVRAPERSRVADIIRQLAGEKPILVAGSTLGRDNDKTSSEEEMVLRAWAGDRFDGMPSFLVVAPRHPERFADAEDTIWQYPFAQATNCEPVEECMGAEAFLLDTIGDLAAVYGVADVAFVGGSLVKRGGHNPLEPAQFGVPVIMGPSFENFRDVVAKMIEADSIRIVNDEAELAVAFTELVTNREAAKAMGERGRRVFEEQRGATKRAVEAIVGMVTK